MIDDELKATFAQDVTLLKKIGIKIVIVHGGGKEITEIANRLGIESRFVDGQRYTDEAMIDVVQMVLAGKTNKDIVARINQCDGEAVGLCGIDAGVLLVKKFSATADKSENATDLGFVGEVVGVNTSYLNLLLNNSIMPVIAPLGVDANGQVYNINADVAAANIASALQAEKLVFLSDVEGVFAQGNLIHSMTLEEANHLITTRIISNGMIPKINSAFNALKAGVQKVHLIDGRVTHSLLLEIFTNEGIGTELVHSSNNEMEFA
ncbi:MAG: acetylglutamate kinase [Ignavibacteriae bacterium]|nr:acetylglutamate kinase [Ignavibacteriota bacterium]